jgi:hypothetical protein
MIYFYILILVGLGSSWNQCGTNGGICHVSHGLYNNLTYTQGGYMAPVNSFIARFGSGVQWSYRYFTEINAFRCDVNNFGNPCSHSPSDSCGDGVLKCSYRYINDDDYYGTIPRGGSGLYKTNEIIKPPYFDIFKVYFSQFKTFTYFVGRVSCQPSLFYADLISYEDNKLITYTDYGCDVPEFKTVNNNFGEWSDCAEEGQFCNFPNTYNIYSVIFISGEKSDLTMTGVIGQFSGNGIMCDTSVFPNVPVNSETYPDHKRYCSFSIEKQFSNITGYWKKVAMCSGESCKMQFSISQGVSSTSSYASTETWSDSFTKSMSNGFHFKFWSNTQNIGSQESHSVTDSSSHAFTQTVSKTCSATCGDLSGPINMWQWTIDATENCHEGNSCNLHIYTCIYMCIPSNEEPSCLPGYCDN